MIRKLLAHDRANQLGESSCPNHKVLVLTLLAPTPVGQDSHYITLVLDKSNYPSTPVTAVIFDTGRGGGGTIAVTEPSSCEEFLYEPVDVDDTWENLDLNEAVRQIKELPEINLLDQQFTRYPLQMNYNPYRETPEETDSDDYKDAWCQTWSWLFGLLVIYPGFVNKIHEVLLDSDIADEKYNNDQCVMDIVRDNLIIPEVLSEIGPHRIGDVVANYQWTVDYFRRVSEIGMKLPYFNTIWLYAAIRLVVPYLQDFIQQPQQTDRDPNSKKIGVSSILYRQADKIIATSELMVTPEEVDPDDPPISAEVISEMLGIFPSGNKPLDYSPLLDFNLSGLFNQYVFPVNDINKQSEPDT
jgi:hypothetical protein